MDSREVPPVLIPFESQLAHNILCIPAVVLNNCSVHSPQSPPLPPSSASTTRVSRSCRPSDVRCARARACVGIRVGPVGPLEAEWIRRFGGAPRRTGVEQVSRHARQGRGEDLVSNGDVESNPGPLHGTDIVDLANWPIGFPTPWLGRPGPLRRAFESWRSGPYALANAPHPTLSESEGFVYEGGAFVHGVRMNDAGHRLVFESWIAQRDATGNRMESCTSVRSLISGRILCDIKGYVVSPVRGSHRPPLIVPPPLPRYTHHPVVRRRVEEAPSLLFPIRPSVGIEIVDRASGSTIDRPVSTLVDGHIGLVSRHLFWNLSDPVNSLVEAQLATQPAPTGFIPASALWTQTRDGPVHDLTKDGDVESNPGPVLRFGRPCSNERGPYIMSLHEAIDEVDDWVWRMAFRSNQRVISTPFRLLWLIRLAPDYVLGMWLWTCRCVGCGRTLRAGRGAVS